jgi:hypothetical protein
MKIVLVGLNHYGTPGTYVKQRVGPPTLMKPQRLLYNR